MNIVDAIDFLVKGLANDSDIAQWCLDNYSSRHTIYEGIDLNNPPPSSDYPVIHIAPMTKNVGYAESDKKHGIIVFVGIEDTTLTTSTLNNISIKKYRGIRNLEHYRKKVETAVVDRIAEVDFEGNFIDMLDITYETIELFPFFLAANMFMFAEDYVQGMDVFE